MQFTDREVQVTDATASGIWLTGDLPIMLEEFMKGDQHGLEIKRARRIATSDTHRRQSTCGIACLQVATSDKGTTVGRRAVIARARCIEIAQGRSLQLLAGYNASLSIAYLVGLCTTKMEGGTCDFREA